MEVKAKTTGVLLMAYGAANSLEEIEPYLLDIRGGRPTSAELVHEIQERYKAIGGKSPLLNITRAQASSLKKFLNKSSSPLTPHPSPLFKVFIGMRHWHPYIKDPVAEMTKGGVQKFIALCLTPYYSKMSVEAYRQKLDGAMGRWGDGAKKIECVFVEHWHDEPLLIQAFAEKLKIALSKFSEKEKKNLTVIFSAHSLPKKILEWRDPYPRQLMETAGLVAKKCGLDQTQWTLAYQSQGRTPEPWLGPDVTQAIEGLAGKGTKNVILDPIGFISDHMETLYDDDILYKNLAESKKMKFVRAETLNAAPALISALASVIHKNADLA
ncbi:MAG: ferrochelatase [Elusimicrobia bacterium]|nr:ferrochelatase [Elusimicrobiota bacterium]